MHMSRYLRPVLVGVVVIALVCLGILGVRALGGDEPFEITADFADTTGLYVGNEVDYLGVPIGEVVAITAAGPTMKVRMALDADSTVPRDAQAEILQSALLTDRFVQLGPTYTSGPRLADGAHIAASNTRSPINIDDLSKAIDELVVALDSSGPEDKDVGDLLHSAATTLDGNGAKIGDMVVSSQQALSKVNANGPDLAAITSNLAVLSTTLADRDTTVRRFTRNLDTASGVLAGQTTSMSQTLASLNSLTTEVAAFMKANRDTLTVNLSDAAAVATTIQSQQDNLARIFDYLPTGAENIWRAYNPKTRAIRVQLGARDSVIFNANVRQEFCAAILTQQVCTLFFGSDGHGVGGGLLDALEGLIPAGL
jgi:phospholipid/cholesterol/gamma-HCH transport system substrate-binding protein